MQKVRKRLPLIAGLIIVAIILAFVMRGRQSGSRDQA